MFGFGKKPENPGAAQAHTQGPTVAQIFLARLDFDLRERATLEDHGGIRSIASVTAVRKLADMPQHVSPGAELDFTHPPQEWELQAQVRSQDGSSFPAVIPLFLDEIGDPPAVGEIIHVVFHPTDRARVRTVACWRGPPPGRGGPRWRVPTVCPGCGAPVDQSVESFAPHPTCRMCKRSLPCEPAGANG